MAMRDDVIRCLIVDLVEQLKKAPDEVRRILIICAEFKIGLRGLMDIAGAAMEDYLFESEHDLPEGSVI